MARVTFSYYVNEIPRRTKRKRVETAGSVYDPSRSLFFLLILLLFTSSLFKPRRKLCPLYPFDAFTILERSFAFSRSLSPLLGDEGPTKGRKKANTLQGEAVWKAAGNFARMQIRGSRVQRPAEFRYFIWCFHDCLSASRQRFECPQKFNDSRLRLLCSPCSRIYTFLWHIKVFA